MYGYCNYGDQSNFRVRVTFFIVIMGQNESTSRQRSSSCATPKFLQLPSMSSGRRSSDVQENWSRRRRSPSPNKLLALPGFDLRRRLSADDGGSKNKKGSFIFLPPLPSPTKNKRQQQRKKSRDFHITIFPGFIMGAKKKKNTISPPQVVNQ